MTSHRKAYEEKFSAQLDEWEARLALLRAKGDKATAEAKIEYFETTDALKAKHDESCTRFNELKASGDDAWEELKSGTEKAWDEFKLGFHNAAKKFK